MKALGDHGDQGLILPRSKWPAGAEPDGKLYDLRVGRHMDAEFIDGEFVESAFHPEMTWVPEHEPLRGSYGHVSAEAKRMNDAQQISRAQGWVFYPHPCEEVKAA